jgi:type IV fimbrial biogenesis protein FimT
MLGRGGPASGVTLIELAVVMAVLAMLIAAAMPSYSGYMASSKVRNAAEAFYLATQKARAEAIRRNEPVELVLTNDTPFAAGGGAGSNILTLNENTNGINWVIRAPNAVAADRLIDAKLGAESGASSVVVNAGGATKIQFNGVGETTSAATVLVAFSHQTVNTNCSLSGAARCLSVRVSVGGQARLCEPGQPATDARSC